jgi:apolipoprotein D and lipocalin family protein
LLLPLLPVHWRERLGPMVPSSLPGVVLPLVRRAWDGREKGTPPQTVAAVDLQRYAGRWHEIARFPTHSDRRCVSQPAIEYRACAQGLTVVNRCRNADGRERVSRGLARVVPGSGGARLEITYAPEWLHWLPFVWADHWILHVDEDYRIALAGTPARDALWLMSRLPEVSIEQFRELIGVARQQGYKLRDLRFS